MFELTWKNSEFHPEMEYMTVKTYGNEQAPRKPHIIHDLNPSVDVTGREIVLIDGVLDSGTTATFIKSPFKERCAAAVRLAVLCENQPHANQLPSTTLD